MELTRRDFLTASAAIGAAFGLRIPDADAALVGPPTSSTPTVVWLQAQSCSGCSVSFLNSMYYASAAELLTQTLNVAYHPTIMAAAGRDAVAVAQSARAAKGYVLVVEGAIPTGAGGAYCYLWPGLTAMKGVQDFAMNARYVIACGTCSSYGGCAAARPNPTAVKSLGALVGVTRVLNIPGCPIHPDWLVGTIAYILRYGKAPEVDDLRRPKLFYGQTTHDRCPYKEDDYRGPRPGHCLFEVGCKGKKTFSDCSTRRWNSRAKGVLGVNWCCEAGSPCQGCTEPGYPDLMSPFHTYGEADDERDHRTLTPRANSQTPTATNADAWPGNTTESPEPSVVDGPQPLNPKSEGKSRSAYDLQREQRRAEYERARLERRKAYLDKRKPAGD
jgi:hydrogenase small subunit